MPEEPIAIIGIGCRFPGGANTPQKFWQLLRDGVDAISEVPEDRWSLNSFYDPDAKTPGKLYARYGGFIDAISEFDAHFFGISPREASRMDPQHRLLLELAYEAIEDACLPPERLAGSATGVFVGISTYEYGALQGSPTEKHLVDGYTNMGGALSIAANRISYVLDLSGPSMSVALSLWLPSSYRQTLSDSKPSGMVMMTWKSAMRTEYLKSHHYFTAGDADIF